MYIHAGGGVPVRRRELVGIFDLDGKITTADTADFLRAAERAKRTVLAGEDLPKSFLVCVKPMARRHRRRARARRSGARHRVIFSPLAVHSLAARGK